MKKSRSNGRSNPIQGRQGCVPGLSNSPKHKQSIDEQELPGPSAIKVYTPSEYLREHAQAGDELNIHANDCSHSVYPSSLSDSVSILSLSLTTPVSEESTYGLPTSAEMSRQDSQFSTSLCDGVNLLGLDSKTSDQSDEYWDEVRKSLHVSMSAEVERPLPITVDTQASSTMAQSLSCSSNVKMRRSSSSESAKSLQPRAVRRHQEQVHQATRPIAPKLTENKEEHRTNVDTSPAHTITYRSADGSMREARAIPKSSRERPMREGLKCTQCDEKPLGFHGQHELQRHIDNVHAVHRRAWICIDISPNKDFLSGCRKCMSQKRYGASYNAAEHLRRAHFHKKPRARQSTGKGSDSVGKDDCKSRTSSSELKRWMREVTDFNPENLPQSDSESRQPSLAHRHGINFDALLYCKDEDSQKAPNLSHRPSSRSPSSSTKNSLANIDIAPVDSQPASFTSCDKASCHNHYQDDVFHLPPITPFPYVTMVDTYSNFEPFIFDSDFDLLPEADTTDFPLNTSLPY